MRILGLLTVVITLCGVFAWYAADNTLTDKEKQDGWQLIFNGSDTKGWSIAGDPESWNIEDGTLHCTGKGGGMLYYDGGQYKNFELKIDFKVSKGGNSGVFLRTWDRQDPVQTGIEVQVLDSYGKKTPGKHDCGAIYDVLAPTINAQKPVDEWNRFHIRCQDNMIIVYLNDKKIIEMDLNQWTEPNKNPDGTPNKFKYAYREMVKPGYIALQNHGNPIWYKNIKLKPLN